MVFIGQLSFWLVSLNMPQMPLVGFLSNQIINLAMGLDGLGGRWFHDSL